MSDGRDYFQRAESWSADVRAISARSRRTAWTVAGVAVAVAAFEALALALLAPLKTVQPITLLVDRQTGYVQALDTTSPKRIAADDALTDAFLAQYVMAREGYDRATVALDYRRAALWSTGRARQSYVATMRPSNPASPFLLYPAGTVVQVRVKSVSRLGSGTALVRFDTQAQDRAGRAAPARPWVAITRFRYSDAPMRFEDRLVNPLGFQVTGYRRDAEAPVPDAAPAAAPVMNSSTIPAPTNLPARISRADPPLLAPLSTGAAPRRRQAIALQVDESASARQQITASQIPSGSPLSPPVSIQVAGVVRR